MEKLVNEKNYIEEERDYWKSNLEYAEITEEIITMERLSNKIERGEFELALADSIVQKINGTFGNSELVKFITYLTALKVEILALFDKEESVVKTPVHEKELKLKNEFILLYDSIQVNDSIRDALNKVKSTVVGGFKNQHIDMTEVLREIDTNYVNDLRIQLTFLYNQMHNERQIEKYAHVEENQIAFVIEETEFSIKLKIVFNKSKISENKIKAIARTYEKVLENVIGNRECVINQMDLISQYDLDVYSKCSLGFNEFEKEETIISVFLKNVELYGNQIAIEKEEESVTYDRLNLLSDRLACGLVTILQDHPSEHIGILMDRNPNMIISILAILKIGKVYVPINTEYPNAKIQEIIEDARITVLISDQVSVTEELLNHDENLVIVDENQIDCYCAKEGTIIYEKEKFRNTPAYIIYTSGTTGKSKGVIVNNRNVLNLLRNTNSPYEFSCNDIWTMFHSYCFDFSVWEMYGALLHGGKLIIIPKEIAKDTASFYSLLVEKGVTVLNQTPGAFYSLIDVDKKVEEKRLALRYVIFGGEALTVSRLKEIMDKYEETQFINMYGITETTVHVTYKLLSKKDLDDTGSNIGKPLPNYGVYIVNNQMKLLPCGIEGEIVVVGEGVSDGYLNREELMKEKFVRLSFDKDRVAYRSGDLAKLEENGDLYYMVRKDRQVKIRGHRIEMGEIEAAILKYPGITDIKLIANMFNEGKVELCCYYCSKDLVTTDKFREYLSDKIVEYGIPSYFIHVDEIKLNKNGKVDVSSLPLPQDNILLDTEYEAPGSELEKLIQALWMKVLQVKKIGVNDDFFSLGGHSLNAINLIALMEEEAGVSFAVSDFFMNSTIRKQAEYIENNKSAQKIAIPKAGAKEYYAMSSAQKRMYYLYEMDKESLAYNMPIVLKADGKLDFDRIKSQVFRNYR